MSDTQQGPGWWLASDGKWYPPTSQPAPPAPPKNTITWHAPRPDADGGLAERPTDAGGVDWWQGPNGRWYPPSRKGSAQNPNRTAMFVVLGVVAALAVVAKAATKTARTATIGRFEATLVRDVATDRVVQGGLRALDWNEPVRVPFEPGMIEWKLRFRLFDEIDREFEGTPEAATVPTGFPFLQVAVDSDKNLTLRADPDALR